MIDASLQPTSPAGPQPSSRSPVRPEIQALRALAVAIVVIYHFWPRVLPGGFVGVDVFFVISGYLITSHLLREVERTGRVSLTSFWAKRARRILPAALAILLLSAVATILFVPIDHWQQFFAEMRASTTYGQNWHLAKSAVDYFAADNGPSPVMHYWSLSAEEQFYLVWPVLILFALLIARNRPTGTQRKAILVLTAGLTLLSLVYGIAHTAENPADAYFVTPTRAWEFGAGGLLALVPWSRELSGPVRAALSWAGMAAIAAAAVVYTEATAFPGTAALLPVLGTLAVMHAGAPRRWAPTPILSVAPVQFVGEISYSIYLWHWPLLVLAPFAIGRGLQDETRLALLALTVVAAWLTKLLIEDPVRRGSFLNARRARCTFGCAAAATAVVMAVTIGGTSHVQAQIRADAQASERILAEAPECFGAAARDPEQPCSNPDLATAVVPTPLEARDRPNAPCTITEQRGGVKVCAFGVPRGSATDTIALVGDSHASHWRAALEVVARQKSWRGLSLTRSGCPFSRTVKDLRDPLQAECVRWNRELPRWFARHPEVSTVFVVQAAGGKWIVPRGRSRFGAEVDGFQAAWKSLPRSVKRIVVIRDTPKDRDDTHACVQAAMAEGQQAGPTCAVRRGAALPRDSAAVAAARLRSPRVSTVDFTRVFCDDARCYPVIGGALVHKDSHHLTSVFAATLGPQLQRALDDLGAVGG